MSRRGRPRHQGKRQPNGQPSRAGADPASPAAMDQRARAIGLASASKDGSKLTRDQRAGTALGQLRMRGEITEAEYLAGEQLGDLWRRWSGISELPPRTPLRTDMGGMDGDPSGEREDYVAYCRRIRSRMDDARAAVLAVPAGQLAWSMLDTVIMDDMTPPNLAPESAMAPRLWRALHDGLGALAALFRIADGKAA